MVEGGIDPPGAWQFVGCSAPGGHARFWKHRATASPQCPV